MIIITTFLKILFALFSIILGFVLMTKPEKLEWLSWAIRHGVDEDGKNQSLGALKFAGILWFFFGVIYLIYLMETFVY